MVHDVRPGREAAPASRLELRAFLQYGIGVVGKLDDLHQRGITHGALTTERIRSGDLGSVSSDRMVDSISEEDLPYVSPEQTGRGNRPVDARSDLYSLGVIFYELLTGRLPFQATDPLEWVHAHLTHIPTPPRQVLPGLSPQVSMIVLRLLAKLPEERYQTAAGLLFDLERCLRSLRPAGRIEGFALGEHDVWDRLVVSPWVYGRERELEQLAGALARVTAGGPPELVLISGGAGIGKSALVRELRRGVAATAGIFVSGKLEQFQPDLPYAAIVQIAEQLIQFVLGEGDQELARWRELILEAVGPNVQALVELVPWLQLVIGEQGSAPELHPAASQHRLLLALRQFLFGFARSGHPLVLFVDDVQWSDSGSLLLLQELLEQSQPRPLLVLATCRSEDLAEVKALAGLREIASSEERMHLIELEPLGWEAVGEMLADTLRRTSTEVAPLARLVAEKTAGNPFFASQFLVKLQVEGALSIDAERGGWRWDLGAVRQTEVTDNVADLIVGRIRTLPLRTRRALQVAACLGSRFDVDILRRVTGESRAVAQRSLAAALRERLLMEVGGGPGAYGMGVNGGTHGWVHDKLQHVAYSAIPAPKLAGLHLAIGRALLDVLPGEERDRRLFEVVSHLNLAGHLLTGRDERLRLAELNLAAGKRARQAGAYPVASDHLELGVALLPPDCWDRCYEVTFRLHLERVEVTALTGDHMRAEQRLDDARGQARSDFDRAQLLAVRADLARRQGDSAGAREAGLAALRLLDIDIPLQQADWEAAAAAGLAGLEAELDRLSDVELLDLAPMDRTPPLAGRLLRQLSSDPDLMALVGVRIMDWSLRWRHPGIAAFSYSLYAGMLAQRLDYTRASRFLGSALRLLERPEMAPYKAGVCIRLISAVDFWFRPLAAVIELAREGYEAGLRTGELDYGHLMRYFYCRALLDRGEPLEQVAAETLAAAVDAEAAGHSRAAAQDRVLYGQVRELIGPQLEVLPPAGREVTTLSGRLLGGEHPFWSKNHQVQELRIAYLFGHHQVALQLGVRCDTESRTVKALFSYCEHCLYHSLTLAAVYVGLPMDERAAAWETMAANRQRLADWAARCPANFEHRHLVLAAEMAGLSGQGEEALCLFRLAAASAAQYGFPQMEALAYELAAGHCARTGLPAEAALHLRDAHAAYMRWGAHAKARQLEDQHRELLAVARVPSGQRLDLLSVVKASQAISAEIRVERLADRLLKIMIEQAGADRGCLLLMRRGEAGSAAEARVEGSRVTVRTVTAGEDLALPETIVNYVRRTGERVLLDDARELNAFSADEHLLQCRPRSVLCLPIAWRADHSRRGRLQSKTSWSGSAVLYLEHCQLSGVFTVDRVAVLEHLASQAGISLENAGLYTELVTERERFRIAFEDAPVGMLILDPDFAVVRLNRAFGEILGYRLADLEGNRIRTLLGEEDAETALSVEALVSGDVTSLQMERRCRHSDGGWVWATINVSLVRDGRGQAVCFLMQVQDVTERRELMEMQVRTARQESEAKSNFLATMSHELRTPLNAIMGFAQLLGRPGRAVLDEKQRRYLGHIQTSSLHLLRLISEILEVTKIQAGQVDVRLQCVQLSGVVEEVVAGLRTGADAHGLGIRISVEAAIEVWADPLRLAQVISNLVGNAIKFTPAGGYVELSAERIGQGVTISVADTGIGIPPDRKERIFQEFFQVDSGRAREQDGLGLGLAISSRLVQLMSGSLTVVSEPGQGSVFSFTLPTVARAPATVAD